MLQGLIAKVTQHEFVASALRATTGLRIVEDSPVDYYWGCGKDGTGANRLGVLWEQVRDMLNNNLFETDE